MGALKGVEILKEERIRQIAEEGYSVEGDVGRANELHRAGTAYLQWALMQACIPGDVLTGADHPSDVEWVDGETLWPWDRDAWKPGTMVENITKGGALIAAALDHADELTEYNGVYYG